jgi:hypothetical protein
MTSAASAAGSARYTSDRARRLALIRYMLMKSEEQSHLSHPFHAPALLLMHDAAELFLVLAAEATGAAVKPNTDFMGYWSPIDDALAPDHLGHKAEMMAVNKARVGLKHSGVIPAPTEIHRFIFMVRSFLEGGTVAVFGINLDQASLAALIPSTSVRSALQEAEAAVAAGDILRALQKARIGFELTLREDDEQARQRAGGRSLGASASRVGSAFSLGLKKPLDQFGRAWDQLVDAVKRTEEAVRLMAKGVDYAEYIRFADLTPHAFWTMGSSEPTLVGDGSQPSPTIADAQWVVDFAVRAALTILG